MIKHKQLKNVVYDYNDIIIIIDHNNVLVKYVK